MGFNEQTREFINFLAGDVDGEFHASARDQFDRRIAIAASMSLMPTWARQLTGTYQPPIIERTLLQPRVWVETRVMRWAIPELACKAMATARARGVSGAEATVAA